MHHSKTHLSGILLMIQSSVAFSLMAFCVKWVSATLPSLEIVFFRSFIGMLMILSVMIHKKIPILGTHRKLMTLRGLTGFSALALYFYTLGKLPLGQAVILNYISPIFSAILAAIFLKERPSLLLILMTLLSFFGVYLLVDGRLNAQNSAVLIGLLSAFFASGAYVTIRAIKHRESPFTVIFYFTAISTFGSLFFFPFGFRWPTAMEWLALAGVGFFSFYGQLWMTISLRRAPASLITPFSYMTPLLTFFYGIFFFKEIPTMASLAGGLLIMLGGVTICYFGTRKKKT